MYQEKDGPSIHVTVTGPEKKAGHIIYSIVGRDNNGEFNVARRYSQFDSLRDTLVLRWPGCYIPGLPQKKVLGNQDPVFIQMRKQGLEYFMKVLKNSQCIWYQQQLKLFLRKQGQTQKQMSKLKQTNSSQILARYKYKFTSYFKKQISKDMSTELIQFNLYLKRAIGLLQNLQKMTQQIYNTRKKFNDKYINLLETLLPEYQKNCVQTYINQNYLDEMIFTGQKRQKLQNLYDVLKKKSNSVISVLQEIKRQKSEILAFQQNLKVKQNYSALKQKAISKVKDLQIETTKINSGKQSLISKIKKKSKEDQLQQNLLSIQKAQEEQKDLAQICQIIIVLLGESQIKAFKKTRENAYYKLLKRLFSLQKEQSKVKISNWLSIPKGNHQKQQIQNFFQAQGSLYGQQQEKQTQETQVQEKQLLIQNGSQSKEDHTKGQTQHQNSSQGHNKDEQEYQIHSQKDKDQPQQGVKAKEVDDSGTIQPKQNQEVQ